MASQISIANGGLGLGVALDPGPFAARGWSALRRIGCNTRIARRVLYRMARIFDYRDRRTVLVTSMLATFAIVRAWLHIQPNADLNVWSYNVHHLFTGVIILTACGIPLVIRSHRDEVGAGLVAGFGVGLTLVLDEWLYLIMTDGSNAAYVQMPSLAGGVVFVAAACLYALTLPRH